MKNIILLTMVLAVAVSACDKKPKSGKSNLADNSVNSELAAKATEMQRENTERMSEYNRVFIDATMGFVNQMFEKMPDEEKLKYQEAMNAYLRLVGVRDMYFQHVNMYHERNLHSIINGKTGEALLQEIQANGQELETFRMDYEENFNMLRQELDKIGIGLPEVQSPHSQTETQVEPAQ